MNNALRIAIVIGFTYHFNRLNSLRYEAKLKLSSEKVHFAISMNNLCHEWDLITLLTRYEAWVFNSNLPAIILVLCPEAGFLFLSLLSVYDQFEILSIFLF